MQTFRYDTVYSHLKEYNPVTELFTLEGGKEEGSAGAWSNVGNTQMHARSRAHTHTYSGYSIGLEHFLLLKKSGRCGGEHPTLSRSLAHEFSWSYEVTRASLKTEAA